MLKFCFVFLLLLKFESVISQNSITGCYSSNFAIIGWFGTQLKLNEDKSFDYLYAGDLFYDKISGTYEILNNELILNFAETTDSLEIMLKDSSGNVISRRFPVPENNAANQRPSKLKIKDHRLIIFDQDGKMVRRKMNSREKWQKYYLVKIPCDQMERK